MERKRLQIADATLCREAGTYGFKEKLEIARLLSRLSVDRILLPEVGEGRADTLLVRTISSFVRSAVLSVAAGVGAESVQNAAAALSGAAHPAIRVELPLSPVGMEYTCHKKPPKMLEYVAQTVKAAREAVGEVEFCAVDATRAEPEFLTAALRAATEAGASHITVCDDAGELLPDDFAAFVARVAASVSVPVSVRCRNKNGMASAAAILAVKAGAAGVVTAVDGDVTPLDTFADILKNSGERYGFSAALAQTEIHRAAGQIARIGEGTRVQTALAAAADAAELRLGAADSRTDVAAAVRALGYDLSEEDEARVYEEFLRVAAKKEVGNKELEAIVASTALQVPPTYTLVSYVINNGNLMTASAQLTIEEKGRTRTGVCLGDGPIDAAFRAIDGITGQHFELDDFKIAAVTEGKEAVGSALVRLRADGRLFSGTGVSTDIIGAAIRAYLAAVNKIVYEETEA